MILDMPAVSFIALTLLFLISYYVICKIVNAGDKIKRYEEEIEEDDRTFPKK